MNKSRINIIMLVTGIITCTMVYAVFFPYNALISMFGVSFSGGALAEIIVRSWGAFVTLIGGMLIYGAFNSKQRPMILSIAGISKLIFVLLLVIYGREYLPRIISIILLDGVTVILYAILLIKIRIGDPASEKRITS